MTSPEEQLLPAISGGALIETWPCRPLDRDRFPPGVRVWAAWLNVTPHALAEFQRMLSASERDRAARFSHDRDRDRFIAARGCLRAILGSCLGVEPSALEVAYGPYGKPFLAGRFARRGLQFNLAHAEDLALFAVARRRSVGVDVEKIRPLPQLPELIDLCCAPAERAGLRQLTGAPALSAFFKNWTRTEARAKATGVGLAHLLGVTGPFPPPPDWPSPVHLDTPTQRRPPPRSAGVSSRTSRSVPPTEPVRDPPAASGTAPLCFLDLAPAPGFLGALAVAY